MLYVKQHRNKLPSQMKFKYRDLQPLPKEGAWSDLLHSVLTQTKVDYSMRPSTFAVRILSYFILLQTKKKY